MNLAFIENDDLSSYPLISEMADELKEGGFEAEFEAALEDLIERVAVLRPLFAPPDPASRTEYEPGEIAQCDFWFPDITVPVGSGQTRTAKQLPVLVMCQASRG